MPDRLGRNLESLLIGPVLVAYGQYIAPVATSRLISSQDQIEASQLSAGVGFVLSVALRAVLVSTGDRTKKVAVIVSLIVTLALLVYCYHIWTLLTPDLQPAAAAALLSQQFLVFVAAMSFFCLTISLSPLAYPTSYSRIVVAVLVIVAVVIVGLLAIYFWQRSH